MRTLATKDAAALEQALNEGRVTILGERGKPSVSKQFVLRLGELPPTLRRLALARGCTSPWADHPDELPACFESELKRARREALEEYGEAKANAALDDLFSSEPIPIRELFLRQIAQMTPTKRYYTLIFSCSLPWWDEYDECPKWLRREHEYVRQMGKDEYRAWEEAGWVE